MARHRRTLPFVRFVSFVVLSDRDHLSERPEALS